MCAKARSTAEASAVNTGLREVGVGAHACVAGSRVRVLETGGKMLLIFVVVQCVRILHAETNLLELSYVGMRKRIDVRLCLNWTMHSALNEHLCPVHEKAQALSIRIC